MRSKSFAFLAVTTAALLFGALTDDASSHKLSSLAVRAFDGAVGTAIDLVRPSAPEKRAEQQSTTSAQPAPASRSGSELQSPLPATANPVETTSFETTLPSGGPATVTEPKTEEDEDVASRTSGAASFGTRGVRPAFGGGPSRSAGNQDASVDPAATTETAADASSLRLDGLMDLVASDLDRDYGAPAGASPLDFTKPSKGAAPSGSPSGSPSDSPSASPSDSAPAQPGTSTETTPPAGSNPSPVVDAEQPGSFSPSPGTAQPPAFSPTPAFVPPVDFSTSPADPSGNPAEGSVPFDIVPDLDLDGLLPDPAVSPADVVDEALILPSNIGPVGLIPPPSAIDVPGALETDAIVNPEPATLLLFGTGLALVAHRIRRRSVR